MSQRDTASLERAVARLRLLIPHARFFQTAEVPAGRVGAEREDQVFQYASFYDHRIGISVRPVSGHTFILGNGFLTSHAYNVALGWLWYSANRGAHADGVQAALRHNYKKFFAECVLDERNCLVGRCFLLETLLYEQDVMQRVFDAVAEDESLRRTAVMIAHTMSMLASQHELSHYFLRRTEAEYRAHADALFDGALKAVVPRLAARYGDAFADEVVCDAFAAHNLISSNESPLASCDVPTRGRIVAFAFMVFADLIGLQLSALATAAGASDLEVDLGSPKRPRHTQTFEHLRSDAMDQRAGEMLELLEAHLSRHGESLFGTEGPFPLPSSTRGELRQAVDGFGDVAVSAGRGLAATDAQRRGLAQLVAESLHDHPRGVEFLLWRSKRFTVGGTDLDP